MNYWGNIRMKRIDRFTIFLSTILIINIILTTPSYAYIDPGTSTMILQMIVAGIVGIAAALKIYWFKVKSLFKRIFSFGKKD